MKTKCLWSTVPLVAAITLAACGGGSSSSNNNDTNNNNVDSLKMPTTLSVLAADSSTTTQAPGVRALATNFFGASRAVSTTVFPATSDFVTDKTNTYVYDSSMESLRTVNMILCLMDQTKADAMLNKGAYIALVDEDKCEQGQNQSSAGSSGQSSGGQTVTYNKWTVNATRASNSDPQIVKIWVPGEPNATDPMAAKDILVEVTVTEGVSAIKPFGSFSMNFVGITSTGTQVMQGMLRTVPNVDNKPQFEFINLGGTELAAGALYGFKEASNVIMDDATGTSGKARTYRKESYDPGTGPIVNERSYALHFNTDLARKAKDAGGTITEACMDRHNFNRQVWRYNLYDGTTGQRVALNSGFPFIYNGKYGHVGYWGVWYEDQTVNLDNQMIARVEYSTGATTNYTVHKAPGKLIRRTRNSITLADLEGMEFYYWADQQYLVTVTGGRFMQTATVTWGTNSGPTTTPITPVDVTPATNSTIWLWSDTLGGNVVYVGGAADATYYSQEFVQPNDNALFGTNTNATVTLKCYDRCLKGGITSPPATEAELYHATNSAGWDYTVTNSGGKVIVSDYLGAPVSVDGIDLSSLGHNWGASTSEMVTTAVAVGITNPWDVYSQAVSYRWETGSNPWNHMTTVETGGVFQVFDKPLQFNYVHENASDANFDGVNNVAYNGKKLMLQYGGPGELWGFPWQQDPNDPNRWYSAVTLKNGVILTQGTNNYVVKAIEQEQSMKFANPANAGDLSACTNVTLDTAGLFATLTIPSAISGNVSFTLADKPTVTTAPAVIGGELQ